MIVFYCKNKALSPIKHTISSVVEIMFVSSLLNGVVSIVCFFVFIPKAFILNKIGFVQMILCSINYLISSSMAFYAWTSNLIPIHITFFPMYGAHCTIYAHIYQKIIIQKNNLRFRCTSLPESLTNHSSITPGRCSPLDQSINCNLNCSIINLEVLTLVRLPVC